jgi:hypothetical protein
MLAGLCAYVSSLAVWFFCIHWDELPMHHVWLPV